MWIRIKEPQITIVHCCPDPKHWAEVNSTRIRICVRNLTESELHHELEPSGLDLFAGELPQPDPPVGNPFRQEVVLVRIPSRHLQLRVPHLPELVPLLGVPSQKKDKKSKIVSVEDPYL